MSHVALLNQNGDALKFISTKQAAILLFKGVAVAVKHTEDDIKKTFRTVDVNVKIVVTKCIRLVKFVNYIYTNEVRWTKSAVLSRDKCICQYCGAGNSRTVDHITPKVKGGRNTFKNTVACCKSCNSKKGHKSCREAGMKLIKQPKVPDLFNIVKNRMDAKLNKL